MQKDVGNESKKVVKAMIKLSWMARLRNPELEDEQVEELSQAASYDQ
jgi:hypothetical protein